MAKAKRKSVKRAAAPKRTKAIRKPKSSRSKSAAARKPGKRKSASPTSDIAGLKRQLGAARDETREALERQSATADILKVIASSPSEVQPVFDAVVNSAARLFEPCSATITTLKDGMLHWDASAQVIPSFDHEAAKALYPIPFNPDHSPSTRAILERRIIAIPDTSAPDTPASTRTVSAAGRFRSITFVPLVYENKGIGTIILTHPKVGFKFSDQQLSLLQTFADQAVIAIENARLFNETKEALAHQTASAEILKVIASSPSDAQPVFDVMVERAVQLCGARMGRVYRYDGEIIQMVGEYGLTAPGRDSARRPFPRVASDETIVGRVMLSRKPDILADLNEDNAVPALSRQMIKAIGARSQVTMPMLLAGDPIGAITLSWVEPRGYNDQKINLLQTFADQAVIAIENTRLFNEVQAKTRDLVESLEQQTATSEVLEVISASQGELEPVFQKMLENATRVCGANFGTMTLFEAGIARQVALYNAPHAFAADPTTNMFRPHPKSGLGTVIRTKKIVHVQDVRTQPPYLEGDPAVTALSNLAGARTLVSVPMLKEDELIGAITIYRLEVWPFTDKQVEVVANFAKQAVIAIENTRLLKELRQRTADLSEALQQQTATSEVLQVISSSAGELKPVFRIMLDNALKICEATYGNMLLSSGDGLEAAELHNSPPAFAELFKRGPLVPPPETALGRVVATKKVVHIQDILAESGGIQQTLLRVITAESMRARTLLAVPMLKESELVGVIVIYRQEVRPFSEKQIELVTSFADQAVIAIENARLLNELRKRTEELSQSLDDLRTAQGRLIQTEKLASLGQLTAGIAHEIKNPLNFVNNFSALSAELTDELNDLLQSAALTEKMREEVDELTKMLKDNLEKVVQHGKRADSIVKNMLLHSREGSGEQRTADINALLDESLNLAYHGARAEKAGFNITLQRDFDAEAGAAELFPQEITRVFLNLISNGFYAATKRKAENGDDRFEPMLRASTKNLGSAVEIRIRDNGIGIPPEVKEKIFNPFFTTKPAGEGTGLGLSMSHDIIVKQHGGSIDVTTEPGQFTELTIVLPRTANSRSKPGGRA